MYKQRGILSQLVCICSVIECLLSTYDLVMLFVEIIICNYVPCFGQENVSKRNIDLIGS